MSKFVLICYLLNLNNIKISTLEPPGGQVLPPLANSKPLLDSGDHALQPPKVKPKSTPVISTPAVKSNFYLY